MRDLLFYWTFFDVPISLETEYEEIGVFSGNLNYWKQTETDGNRQKQMETLYKSRRSLDHVWNLTKTDGNPVQKIFIKFGNGEKQMETLYKS